MNGSEGVSSVRRRPFRIDEKGGYGRDEEEQENEGRGGGEGSYDYRRGRRAGGSPSSSSQTSLIRISFRFGFVVRCFVCLLYLYISFFSPPYLISREEGREHTRIVIAPIN